MDFQAFINLVETRNETEAISALRENTQLALAATPIDKRTALHYAVALKLPNLVSELVKTHNSPILPDRFQITPITEAYMIRDNDTAKFLEGYLPIINCSEESNVCLTECHTNKWNPESGTYIMDLSFSTDTIDFNEDITVVTKTTSDCPTLPARLTEVQTILAKEGIFSNETIVRETHSLLCNTGFSYRYLAHFTSEQIAQHVSLLIGAKQSSTMVGTKKLKNESITENEAIYLFTTNNNELCREKIASAATFISSCIEMDTGYRVLYLASESIDADDRLVLIQARKVPMAPRIEAENPDAFDINKVSSQEFLNENFKDSITTYETLVKKVLESRGPVAEVRRVTQEKATYLMVQFASFSYGNNNFIRELDIVLTHNNITPVRIYAESFSNGVVAHHIYLHSKHTVQDCKNLILSLRYIPHLKMTPDRSAVVWDLMAQRKVSPIKAVFLNALMKFGLHFIPKYSTSAEEALSYKFYSAERFYRAIANNYQFCMSIFDDFKEIAEGRKLPFYNDELAKNIYSTVSNEHEQQILAHFLKFNQALRLTNFFKKHGSLVSLSFLFDPEILFSTLCRPGPLSSESVRNSPHSTHSLSGLEVKFPETPFAVYLIVGRGFHGFHVRFSPIARGGIRLITSRDIAEYEKNLGSLLEETYSLAFTQQLKNKDIPEGGSKGTILLDSKFASPWVHSQVGCRDSFFKYIDALLDCMLPEQSGIYTGHLKEPEILFFGPDEGTAGFMDLGAERAKARGYKFWKSLTTGKSTIYGGVPHDKHRCTTTGVHQYVLELLKYFELPEEKITKIQTGGPDGDLGSSEILISKDITLAVVDGSGVAYDPNGLNREELCKLAKARIAISNFDASKIGTGGFHVPVTSTNIVLPDGSEWVTGFQLRNEFLSTSYASADLFVPCGGRPKTINAENWQILLNDQSMPKFKYIVEGANLFLTDPARRALQQKGVILIKDASANKGGVTSSSLEVLASLAVPEEIHNEYFTLPLGTEPVPETHTNYCALVSQILMKIKTNATKEFNAIIVSDDRIEQTLLISKKINRIKKYLKDVINPETQHSLLDKLFKENIPDVIMQAAGGTQGILANVPHGYVESMISCYIAGDYVYNTPLDSNEVDFFKYMQQKQSIIS